MYYEDLKTNDDDLFKPRIYTDRRVPSENETSEDDGSEAPKVAVDYDTGAITDAAVKVDEIKSGDPGDFKHEDFNFSNDPLFQMYQSMYMGNAQKAMKGAIADSALLTGGYGNSWAQSAGQQAYDDTMDGFYSMIPSLYSAAYGKYSDEKQRAEDEHAKKVSAWNLEMAAANSALEDAIDSAQQDVLDDYLPYIESGKMTWDEVYEALGDLVYTDAEGNEVPLFTKEGQKAYEDAYNASVAAQEAAYNAFELELIEMLLEHPEYATEEYLTAYYKDNGYAPDEGKIKSYVENYKEPVDEDWKTPTGEMWKKAEDLYNSYRFGDLEDYAANLRAAGYDASFIEALYDEGKEIFRTSDSVKKIIGRDYKQQKDGWNWWGGADTDDVFSYSNTEERGTRELVEVTVDEIIDELVKTGVPKDDAVAWVLANLPGA